MFNIKSLNQRWLSESAAKVVNQMRQLTPRQVAVALLRFVVQNMTLVLGLMILANSWAVPKIDSLPEITQVIYRLVWTIGLVWILAEFVYLALQDLAFEGNRNVDSSTSVVRIMLRNIMLRFVVLLVALVAVRAYSSELVNLTEFIKENPDTVIVVGIAIVVLRMVFWMAPAPAVVGARSSSSVVAKGYLTGRRERSSQDIYRTSVHEAGHVLMYGGRDDLPDGLSVRVYPEVGSEDLYRGHVTHTNQEPEVLTKSYLYWTLLLYLAGSGAEVVVLGEAADGSRDDNRKWLSTATTYLTNGFGEAFYANPEGNAQVAHNRAILNDLKERCMYEVGVFLTMHQALLNELANVIADQKTMNREQLAPYLARVVSIEKMPRLHAKPVDRKEY